MEPLLANLEIFPFGWQAPFELDAGLFDEPFGDFWETQYHNWVNPFITPPLPFNNEAIGPSSGLGLQARGGIQVGRPGQDADYTVWIDSGPNFESAPGASAIPALVIGEAFNPFTALISPPMAKASADASASTRFLSMPSSDASN